MDPVETFPELSNILSNALRTFSFYDYTGHQVGHLFHLRLSHAKPSHLCYSTPYPARGLKMPPGLNIIGQQVPVQNDVRVLKPLLDSLTVTILCNVRH